MRICPILTDVFSLLFYTAVSGQSKKFTIHTVAFYNFENLFDTINDPNTFDEDWTPTGSQHWTFEKYEKKLDNLSRVLSVIGTAENPESPTFIGGCEIENRGVLEDLIQHPKLIDTNYGIIHFDSPDKRGIDVALLYKKKHFQPTNYSNIPLYVFQGESKSKPEKEENTDDVVVVSSKNKRVYTRDQLLVTGFLDGEEIHLIVNHWPSR